MNRVHRTAVVLAAAVAWAVPAAALAQDVAITNARIVVGNGTVIDAGTIVVRGGKIVSVSAGAANTRGVKTIDAKGMSAIMRARFTDTAMARWCLAQLPDNRRGTSLPRSVMKYLRRLASL